MRGTRPWVSLSVIAVALALTGPAYAAPITSTESQKFSESFSDEAFICQDELYEQTVTGHLLTHQTARTDADGNIVPPLRFHFLVHAKVVAVPLDGTGTTFTGHFRSSDSETIRSVKHGAVIAETDTDQNKVVAKGSDGSHLAVREHHHFTVNANGDVSIEFEKSKSDC